MPLETFRSLLDTIIRAERQVDVLNLSGGEPFLHPELLAFVDEALSRPEIVRVSISTNGLALSRNTELLRALHERNVVVSLQFDGFKDGAYEILRGRPLLEEKERILRILEEEGISTSVTMTAARGINDDQFRPILDYLFSHEHVVSLMIQPVAFAGRATTLPADAHRLTIPDVVKALGESGHPAVSAADFVPLPCSHPLCFSLSFYLMLDDGGAIALNQLADAATLLDSLANRVVFGLDAGEHERLKQMLYALWSGPAASSPDSAAVIGTVRKILREMSKTRYEPRAAFTLAERRVKSIFLHAFQDARTFDLARVRRCCQAYLQPDGSLMSPCVRNVLRKPLWSSPTNAL
jgi:7,8-dihydro-6-hydroxymethylpterin dimethyltransferase